MKECGLSVLEQYPIEVNGTRKVRGAILCDTKQGLFILKEATISSRRAPMLYRLSSHLEAQGYEKVDKLLLTKDGDYISTAEDGNTYVMKRWFYGRECDIRKEQEVVEATKNLANLHKIMKMKNEFESYAAGDLRDEFVKHNRELKKVRSFIRNRPVKGEFELAYLNYFDILYHIANHVLLKLEGSNYGQLKRESLDQGAITHGDYNYHNVLMTPCGIATTNMEHFYADIQVSDMYYFLRKAMEKYHWKTELGDKMINAYASICPISQNELEYIAIRLAYPEKFWKSANMYYHSNKAWIPAKNIEKLQTVISQSEEKKRFLQNIFAFQL